MPTCLSLSGDCSTMVVITMLFLFALQVATMSIEEVLVRESFHKTFHHKCKKYKFVERFWDNLENPSHEFVEFVYHEPGLRNGGFGDRLGGLITATAIALRLNRTLLIKSANGFGEYFRPFARPVHHADGKIGDSASKHYTYLNYSEWTSYNSSMSNNDETELDLWNCINMNGKVNDWCGLDYSESIVQPIIKLRSNRCYLCKWMLQDRPARTQLKNILGLDETANLFEVGGCLLRLAMWPTDALFSKLAEIFQTKLQPLFDSQVVNQNRHLAIESTAIESRKFSEVNGVNIHHLHSHRQHVFGAKQHHLPILVGMHFRCGDWSYMKGRSIDETCKHDVTRNASDYKELGESEYMRFGTPADIGSCARQIIQNISDSFDSLKNSADGQAGDSYAETLSILAHIASDNPGSAKQMAEYAKASHAFNSPFGCHVERDSSQMCTEQTILYWLLLSMSDFIVTQVEFGCPISGFSRFAGIYGLKGDSIVTAKNCELESFTKMGWTKNGNWVCG